MHDVLMVMVSYNNERLTNAAIDAILGQKNVSVHLVVWDNASSDNTVLNLHKKWGESSHKGEHKITIEPSFVNLLWSPAINKAIEDYWAGEKYIGFMNNDIFLPEEAIGRMVEVLATNPKAGLVAPMGSRLGGPQDWAANMGEWPAGIDDLAQLSEHIKDNPPKRVTYAVGACCVMPKAVWDDVGVLDEDMPLGADDHDYSIRLKENDYQIIIATNVFADHAGHASGKSPYWEMWGGKSWEAFNKKWDGYYKTEEEAIKCHWDGDYIPGWDKGTGWDDK